MKRLFIALLMTVQGECSAIDNVAPLRLLRSGEELLVSGEFVKSLQACREGLNIIGNSYSSPDLIDDTDLKLFAATYLEKEGKVPNAAMVTCRILRDRYELLQAKVQMGFKEPS